MPLFAVMSALVTACGAPPAEPTTREGRIALLMGKAETGAPLFASNCAGCHGADGKGKTGPSLVGRIHDAEPEVIIGYVVNGKGKMPKFDTLTDQQVADLYAHLNATFTSN